MKTIDDIKNELPDVPVKRPDGSVVMCQVKGSKLPFARIHTPNGGEFECTWDLVWRVATGQTQYILGGFDNVQDSGETPEGAFLRGQVERLTAALLNASERNKEYAGLLRKANEELDKAKADVLHWREARQSAIEGGDMLKTSLDQCRHLYEEAADGLAEAQKQRDVAQGERHMLEQEVQELRDQIRLMTQDLNEERILAHEDGFKQGWKAAMDRLPELEITGPEQGEPVRGRIAYCFDEGDDSVGLPSSDWLELDSEA